MRINKDNHIIIGFCEIPIRWLWIAAGCILGVLAASIATITFRKELWSLITNPKNLVSVSLAILATVLTVKFMFWQNRRMAKKESSRDKIAVIGFFRKMAIAMVGVIFLLIAAFSWIFMETIQDNLLVSLPVIILISITVVWWVKKENEKERQENQKARKIDEEIAWDY
jgi:uncharacterized membrane protein